MKYLILVFFIIGTTSLQAQKKFKQKGMASYYAGKFNGRKTASGEIFDSKKLTAAHRTLPFGTVLKVTNLNNSKTVVVKVNDRGPFARGRIVDLSQAAAKEIDMMRSGTARVQIEVIGKNGELDPIEPTEDPIVQQDPGPSEEAENNTLEDSMIAGNTYSQWGTQRNPKGFGIQVGSYEDLENAKDLCKSLKTEGFEETYIQVGWGTNQPIYRVLIGAFIERQEAKKKLDQIKKAGRDGFVKQHFD